MDDNGKPWYQENDFKKLQKEWYKKLSTQGFYDIEGGVEGHLLKGPTSSVSLRALTNNSSDDHGLKHDRAPREFDDVADSENGLLNYSAGAKARYYHHAMLIAVQATREGSISDERCYAWTLHANGSGERAIAELLELPRSQIRKHIKALRDNIVARLDNEHR